MQTCPSYAGSKTSLLDASLIEPSQFLPFINAQDMNISNAQEICAIELTKRDLLPWLRSYSFKPQNIKQEKVILEALEQWFEIYKTSRNSIRLEYVGFVTQGVLRSTVYPYSVETTPNIPKSPIASSTFTNGKCHDFWPNKPQTIKLRARL